MKKILISLLLCICILPVQVFAAGLETAIDKPMPQKGVLTYDSSVQVADEASEDILYSFAPVVLSATIAESSFTYEMVGEKKMKVAYTATYLLDNHPTEVKYWVDYDYDASKLLVISLEGEQYSYIDVNGEHKDDQELLNDFANDSSFSPASIYNTMKNLARLLSATRDKDGVYRQTLVGEESQKVLKELSFEMVGLAGGVSYDDADAEELRQSISEYYDVLLKDIRLLDENKGITAEVTLDANNSFKSSSYVLNLDIDAEKYLKAMEMETKGVPSGAKGTVELKVDYSPLGGEVIFPELTAENSINVREETPKEELSRYDEGWNIVIEGDRLGMKNAPYVENDRALAAGQALCNALGAEYTYENGILTVNDGEMVFTAGSDKCLVNGTEKTLDVTPKEIDYELFVPVRFLAEQLGYEVGFSQELSADGKSVYASIVLIDPAKMKMQLVMPESQTQQQQVAQLAATISDVELTLLNSPSDSHKEWVAVTLAAGDPVVIYETTEYPLPNGAVSEYFYDLTPFLETSSPETLQWINRDENIKKSVTDDKGAIIAFPVQCGETVEQFYVPIRVEHPDKVIQFLQTYSTLAKELIVK